MVSKVYLGLASIHFILVVWFYQYTFKLDSKFQDKFLGWLHHRCSFLTILSFQSNTVFYFIAAIQKKSNHISQCYLLLVKLSLWVAIIYWLMYLNNPAMVLNENSYIHPVLSNTLHGFNIPLIMIPLFITSNKLTTASFTSDLLQGVTVMLGYNCVLLIHKLRFGFHVYPFVNELVGLTLIKFNLFVVGWIVVWGFVLRLLFFR